MKGTVVVGFSGGKDSTTASILLKKQGYKVKGLTMLMGFEGEAEKSEKIKKLGEAIGIEVELVDFREPFNEKVVDYFIKSYVNGETPNPCALCNRDIKFGLLMDYAFEKMGADKFATGHYADKMSIEGFDFLSEPAEQKKTQIYFLSLIGRERLKNILFPLFGMSLDKVRETVAGLPLVGGGKESQDICFLEGGKLEEFLRDRLPEDVMKPGDILDIDGKKIGTHRGAFYFTIGQRRGTGFASDRKLYVVKKDMVNNTITLGDEKYLYSEEMELKDMVFWSKAEAGDTLKVKIRYMTEPVGCTVTEITDDNIKVKFEKPVKSVTRGQVGVFYKDDIITAAGIIL